ncbi:MAG: hypothetical protein KKE23_00525 [Nanoarchaeota archaeon]|nr:hypothetical protein [Nanoarchaeota archaeon]
MAQRRKWNKYSIIKELKRLEIILKRRPSKRDNSNLYALTRQYFGSWNNAMQEAGFEIKSLQTPITPKRLNKDLSYLIGLIITDGHIVYDKIPGLYKVLIYSSYEEERDILSSIIQKLFKYSPGISIRNNIGFSKKPNYEIRISSKKWQNF